MLKAIIILFISERLEKRSAFIHALQDNQKVNILTATSVEEGISMAEYYAPALIIVDEQVGALSGLEIVRRLIKVNAFLNTIVLSSLSDEDFQLHTEGLGILAKLSIQPGEKEADRVFDLLDSSIPL
jgi:DNA-binding response OmpR family regulator